MSPYSNNLCEQQYVYRRICPAGGHHPKGDPSLRADRLLPEPRRRGKYRVYRAEDLEWVGFIREAQRLGCKLGELVPLLAGVTSLDHFPWQKVEQLIADKLAQIEAEVARLQRQHQGLSQCATLLAQHPCRYGAPARQSPDERDHPAAADRGQKVA
ncbi:MerR family DNA-binding protein [Aeromonas caviae]